jgi:hypothetical protein
MARLRFRPMQFFVLHSVQTDSDAHPASFSMGTVGSLPGGKRTGRDADHTSPSSAEVKKVGVILSFPHVSSSSTGTLTTYITGFS